MLSTRPEGAQCHDWSLYGARDAHLADADLGVEDEHVLAGLGERRLGVPPVVGAAEDIDLTELGIAAHPQRDISRDDDAEVADIDASPDVRLLARKTDIAQVEGQIGAIDAKAQAKIYGSLTADQKAKVDAAPGGIGRLGMMMGGRRGPGGPPPAPAAAQ